jgi:hypothetical protein
MTTDTNSQSTPQALPNAGQVSERLIGDVETFLQEALTSLEPDLPERRRSGPGRPRILPSLCLWAGLLVCVLRGFGGQRAIWRLISSKQLWFYPRFALSDQAIYKRLAQEGTAPLEWLFGAISAILRQRLESLPSNLAPFATQVVALDEVTLDPLARSLPSLRHIPPGDDRLLPGKMCALFDLRLQQWLHLRYIPEAHQNEKLQARQMVALLPKGSLVLADLGYFGFAWFDELSDLGYHFISRLRAKTSYRLVHTYFQDGHTFDGLVFLGAHRADRAKHAVRLVRFQVGKTSFCYITNVEPAKLSLRDIARLYARRWDIEMAFKLAKRDLKLHLLWSAKTMVLLQQVWAVLIISQVIQALRFEIAQRANVDLFDVSLPLLIQYAPQIAYDGEDPVSVFVTQGRQLAFIRPSRRTVIQAPDIPVHLLTPLPPDIILTQTARHANRNCGPR